MDPLRGMTFWSKNDHFDRRDSSFIPFEKKKIYLRVFMVFPFPRIIETDK